MGRALALLLLVPAVVSADQVILKGGRRLTGVVVEKTEKAVVLDVGPGRLALPAAQIERIETGQSALATYRARAAALGLDDTAGWLDLALWARDAGLETQAQGALARVLELDPGNAPAHRALGHVRHGDLWLSLEEKYRAQGLVPFEGSWITPAERQAIASERAEAAAADRARMEAEARAREAEARASVAEAEARRAEAAQREAASNGGWPYGWIFGGGCSGIGCGHVSQRRPHTPRAAPLPEPPPPPSMRDTGRQRGARQICEMSSRGGRPWRP